MAVKFTRRHKPKALVDLVPMIDIVFQLVIFFMIATTFKTTTGMELEVPQATQLTEIPETPLSIKIFARDKISVGEHFTDMTNLSLVIQEMVPKNKTGTNSVIVYGNKNMEYQLLVDVMDVLRIQGFESIDLAINQKALE